MNKELLEIPTQTLQLISADQAYHYRVIPFNEFGNKVFLKTDATKPNELLAELQIMLNKEIVLEQESSQTIEQYLQKNYRKRARGFQSSSLHYSEDFLLNMIYEAKEIGSSDLHFEAFEKQHRVRFRIDGKLIEKYIISLDEYPKIVNRIKIMARLDISEK